jgi:hypothetical protein
VTFELPTEIEQNLRREFENLDEAAKEATLVEMYRRDKLSHHELSVSLGLTRLEAEAVLKRHNVTEDFATPEEYDVALFRLRANTNE